MDMYDYSFFLSTMWVGPFWFAMLVFPEHEMTKKVMQGPWFFLGPITDLVGCNNSLASRID